MALVTHSRLIVSGFSTPAGSFHLGGLLSNSSGIPPSTMRRLGRYAIVFVTGGGGIYSDEAGRRLSVQAGDLLILFPEIAHNYGPARGEQWDEFYLVFSGPAFDLWRKLGLIDAESPLVSLGPVDVWLERWLDVARGADTDEPAGQHGRICRLLELIGKAFRARGADSGSVGEPAWLFQAKLRLGSYLDSTTDYETLASDIGMTYETFRKRFAQATGTAPAQYRAGRKIAAGRDLLLGTSMSLAQIAETLGFSSEFHFSRRFKQLAGVSPSEYRRRQRGREPSPNSSGSGGQTGGSVGDSTQYLRTDRMDTNSESLQADRR